jgi:predicted nucleic acid-binding protein
MSRVADTSFLFAAFDRSDSRQAAAFEELREPSPIHVPPEVVGEMLGVLQKRKGADAAREFWTQIQAIPHLRMLDTTDTVGVSNVYRDSKRLTWVDASVVHWCRHLGARPLCYDQDIQRMAARRN